MSRAWFFTFAGRLLVAFSICCGLGTYSQALAQSPVSPASQTAPPIGSPAATTTIDGKQLPAPDPAFGGVIQNIASESKPWWAPRIVPPAGAPNVLLIMTDDWGTVSRVHLAG